ncbi:hypothetical protein LQD23_18305 [Chromobacterium violaceum]|uniref:hypothetical protein n=1 Tax=Chromobacterium violaceum TaxID=536 RepID=UPI001E40BDC4|nr:hypothetical protein [Chromobacterium violaceum]MCD0494230.1 hypothetical protein [Chromobacterium violaceum]
MRQPGAFGQAAVAMVLENLHAFGILVAGHEGQALNRFILKDRLVRPGGGESDPGQKNDDLVILG